MCTYDEVIDYFAFDVPLRCDDVNEYRLLEHIKNGWGSENDDSNEYRLLRSIKNNCRLENIDKDIENYVRKK